MENVKQVLLTCARARNRDAQQDARVFSADTCDFVFRFRHAQTAFFSPNSGFHLARLSSHIFYTSMPANEALQAI